MKKISTLLLLSIPLSFAGFAQNDVGCSAVIRPINNDTIFSNTTSLDPQYTRTNFGTNTISASTLITMRFYVNGVKIDTVNRPASAGDFAGGAAETRTIGRDINFTLGNLVVGLNKFCVEAYTPNDANRSNDTTCINFYYSTALAAYDVELVDFTMLSPAVANGGDIENTSTLGNVGFKIKNVGVRAIPAGFTGQINVTAGTNLGGPYNTPITNGLAIGATTTEYSFGSTPSNFPLFPSALGSFQACVVWLGPNDPNMANNSSCGTYNMIQGFSFTSFTPSSGYIGSTITLNGQGFSTTPANNTVKFNGVAATVLTATSTQITCSVPVGATTGKISVTVAGKTKESGTSFLVLPNASSVAEIINAPFKAWYANGILNYEIGTSDITEQMSLKIFNASGALVMEHQIARDEYNGNRISVDVSTLPSGIYVTNLNGLSARFAK
jgi:hypothetical protein